MAEEELILMAADVFGEEDIGHVIEKSDAQRLWQTVGHAEDAAPVVSVKLLVQHGRRPWKDDSHLMVQGQIRAEVVIDLGTGVDGLLRIPGGGLQLMRTIG